MACSTSGVQHISCALLLNRYVCLSLRPCFFRFAKRHLIKVKNKPVNLFAAKSEYKHQFCVVSFFVLHLGAKWRSWKHSFYQVFTVAAHTHWLFLSILIWLKCCSRINTRTFYVHSLYHGMHHKSTQMILDFIVFMEVLHVVTNDIAAWIFPAPKWMQPYIVVLCCQQNENIINLTILCRCN